MPETEHLHIGKTIRTLRQAVGLSQVELARRVGISPALLSLWEGGQRDPTIAGLRSLSTQIGVPAALLFAVALETPDGASRTENQELLDKLVSAARSTLLAERLLPAKDAKMNKKIVGKVPKKRRSS